ncbi:hypothetical protein BZA70DRAFT_290044 [Myxozyma melibiosi]|uniref:DUF3020 domain-containing protein n=1 Tax=Myxozyma melibiosi TaxID=54550 RepID=A0ABR1F6L8_9ASCO
MDNDDNTITNHDDADTNNNADTNTATNQQQQHADTEVDPEHDLRLAEQLIAQHANPDHPSNVQPDITSMLHEAAAAAGISLDSLAAEVPGFFGHDLDNSQAVEQSVLQTQPDQQQTDTHPAAPDQPPHDANVDNQLPHLDFAHDLHFTQTDPSSFDPQHEQHQQQQDQDEQQHFEVSEHFDASVTFDHAPDDTTLDASHFDLPDSNEQQQQEQQEQQQQEPQPEEEQIELSEALQAQVAALALELQQSGLENLSPEELQQHVMERLLAGDFGLAQESEQQPDEVPAEQPEQAQPRPSDTPAVEVQEQPAEQDAAQQDAAPEHAHADMELPHDQQLVNALADHDRSIAIDPAFQTVEHQPSEPAPADSQPIDASQQDGEQPQDAVVAADGETGINIEQLNEIIMGMDLSDPATAIAQLQAATHIDPATLLQAVTQALTSVLGGEDEVYDADLLGEDGTPVRRKRERSKKSTPATPQQKQKLKVLNRLRKKRWRQFNDERNKDNDLRCRLYRRADAIFGKLPSDDKSRWIETEFHARREKRIARMQREAARNFGSGAGGMAGGALSGLFGQAGIGEELQAALAEIMGRESDVEKFNNMLLQLARDPNLIRNLTSMLEGMDGEEEERAPGAGGFVEEMQQQHEQMQVQDAEKEVDALSHHLGEVEQHAEVHEPSIDPSLEHLGQAPAADNPITSDETNNHAQEVDAAHEEHGTAGEQLITLPDGQQIDMAEAMKVLASMNIDLEAEGVDQTALLQAFSSLLEKPTDAAAEEEQVVDAGADLSSHTVTNSKRPREDADDDDVARPAPASRLSTLEAYTLAVGTAAPPPLPRPGAYIPPSPIPLPPRPASKLPDIPRPSFFGAPPKPATPVSGAESEDDRMKKIKALGFPPGPASLKPPSPALSLTAARIPALPPPSLMASSTGRKQSAGDEHEALSSPLATSTPVASGSAAAAADVTSDAAATTPTTTPAAPLPAAVDVLEQHTPHPAEITVSEVH